MKDKSYPSKLAEDLNRLSKIPVGRSYAEEGSAIHQLIATKNARITKLEQTNIELLEALRQSQWLLNWVWTSLKDDKETNGFIYGEVTDTRIKNQIEKAIKEAEGKE